MNTYLNRSVSSGKEQFANLIKSDSNENKRAFTGSSDYDSVQEIERLQEHLYELHPIKFRLAFGLTHEQAAEALCIEPQTMRAYVKNKPSKRIKKLAAEITKRWLADKRRKINISFLID